MMEKLFEQLGIAQGDAGAVLKNAVMWAQEKGVRDAGEVLSNWEGNGGFVACLPLREQELKRANQMKSRLLELQASNKSAVPTSSPLRSPPQPPRQASAPAL